MLYVYDDAIVNDLFRSFNPSSFEFDNIEDVPEDQIAVKVMSPEQSIGIAAQIQDDKIKFPVVCLERRSTEFAYNRRNFVAEHKGVPAFIDTETNNIYNEKSIPVDLTYTLTVLTTNQYDMDEVLREILFKYSAMYFLSVKIPYEGKREISFGIVHDKDAGIEQVSGPSQYIDSGQLYQSSITLRCEGCVLINYTPVHLKRGVIKVTAEPRGVV